MAPSDNRLNHHLQPHFIDCIDSDSLLCVAENNLRKQSLKPAFVGTLNNCNRRRCFEGGHALATAPESAAVPQALAA